MFVRKEFNPPASFTLNEISFKPLSIEFVKEDFNAVMESIDLIKVMIGSDWPPNDLTLSENFESIKLHEKQFKEKTGFTYSVFLKNNYILLKFRKKSSPLN